MLKATGQPSTATTEQPRWTLGWVALGLLPLILLAGVLAVIVMTDGGLGDRNLPPIEDLSIQRISLPHAGLIEVEVVNNGPDPVTIAQVQVDTAYWTFDVEGPQTLDRFDSATVQVPYPWVEGETHLITLLSQNGVTFEGEVPVAVKSPEANASTFGRFALIGFYVGIVPIALGMLWFPFLQRIGEGGMQFILALTIGLLAFLVVDTFQEAREVAASAPAAFEGPVLVPLVALLSFLLIMAVGGGKRDDIAPLGTAYRIAFGIGLHNLGEGLAIGAAFALGEVALGVFLIVGFTVHNVTEGVGIEAPLLRDRPALKHFVALALVAGAPAILGVWIGGFVYSAFWATIFLSIGIGALAQVVVEISRLIARRTGREGQLVNWTSFAGVATGIAVMYATALFVSA